MFKSRIKKLEERIEALEKTPTLNTVQIKCLGIDIGKNIKERRKMFGYTQENLAKMVGIGQPMMAQIERGTKIPNMLLGRSIAQALECKVEDLYGEA